MNNPLASQFRRLLVATTNRGDSALDSSVRKVLACCERRRPGKSLIRPGDSNALEGNWCRHVVTGRPPEFVKDTGPLRASGATPHPTLAAPT